MGGPHNFITRQIELSDLDIAQVALPHCGNDDGRSEAGLWLGNTARAQRVRVRDCGWMGVWTGSNCFGTHIGSSHACMVLHGSFVAIVVVRLIGTSGLPDGL